MELCSIISQFKIWKFAACLLGSWMGNSQMLQGATFMFIQILESVSPCVISRTEEINLVSILKFQMPRNCSCFVLCNVDVWNRSTYCALYLVHHCEINIALYLFQHCEINIIYLVLPTLVYYLDCIYNDEVLQNHCPFVLLTVIQWDHCLVAFIAGLECLDGYKSIKLSASEVLVSK